MSVLYVVGCGAQKLPYAAPAASLYTGSLFTAARRYVERTGAPWRILSARYGLVQPTRVLEPYEQRLWRGQADRAAWGLTAASGICYECGRGLRVVFLCGVDYADPVARTLQSWGVATEQPLVGLGLGARLHWFKTRSGSLAQ